MFDNGAICTNITNASPTRCDEAARLASLEACRVLDTPDEPVYDALTELARTICGTSIGIISLVDRERLWFKSRSGVDAREIPRQGSFCSSAIQETRLFQIPNALNDPRFRDNLLVNGPLAIRFYCGVPLLDSNGLSLGMLCVLDRQPRRLSDVQCNALRQLASVVMYLLENRRNDPELLHLGVVLERTRLAASS
ncbi:MAG: GAF domain-containing protein [Dokdonella sp.]